MPLADIVRQVIKEPEALPTTEAAIEGSGASTEGQESTPITNSEPTPISAEPSPEDNPFDWGEVPEQLLPLAKKFQGDYTRKTQALAEQRKQFEGLSSDEVAGFKAIQQLIREDPARAAMWFRQQSELLQQAPASSQEDDTDLLSLIEPEDETQRLLLQQVQEMRAEQKEFRSFYEQQLLEGQKRAIDAEFQAIEQNAGRTIPESERNEVAKFAVTNNIPNVTFAYRLLSYDKDLANARQNGVNEASSLVQQKLQGSPAPSPGVARNTAPEGPKGLASYVREAMSAERDT